MNLALKEAWEEGAKKPIIHLDQLLDMKIERIDEYVDECYINQEFNKLAKLMRTLIDYFWPENEGVVSKSGLIFS